MPRRKNYYNHGWNSQGNYTEEEIWRWNNYTQNNNNQSGFNVYNNQPYTIQGRGYQRKDQNNNGRGEDIPGPPPIEELDEDLGKQRSNSNDNNKITTQETPNIPVHQHNNLNPVTQVTPNLPALAPPGSLSEKPDSLPA